MSFANNIHIHTHPGEPTKVEMTCDQDVYDKFFELFEVPMLQGEHTEFTGGTHMVAFIVEGEQAAMIKDFVAMIMSPSPTTQN